MMVAAVRSTGLGELTVVRQSDDVLTARGLGSCVGIAVYEPSQRIAMMAHVMLPGPAPEKTDPTQPARFAAQAVESILREVEQLGGRKRNLVIKLAGGAQVIRLYGKDDRLQVGQRNIQAVREALARAGLPIVGEHVGGNVGRTLSLHAATGVTTYRVVGGQEVQL